MSRIAPMPFSRRAALRGIAGGFVAGLATAPLGPAAAQHRAAVGAGSASDDRLIIFESDANG
ncbi:MAG TPA: hypothetical protein VFI22_08995, partial [Thermomicrobiales bacterium]|nr:hypothetical protein [Thermomicrobiales bacterium]